MKETLLFKPVKELLELLGFQVQAEIDHVDVVGVKGEEIVIVELKNELNIHVIAQAINRQTITDYVYISINKPSQKVFSSKTFKDKVKIIKQLSIGLIFVSKDAQIIHDPVFKTHIKKQKKKMKLLNTFHQLKENPNIGGSYQTKLMTLYKQQALTLGYYLLDGPKKVSELKHMSQIEKAQNILYKNFYGWFESNTRGIYQLTKKGYETCSKFTPFKIQ